MNILVINSGSSSIKYRLLEMDRETVLAEGLVERIGEKRGIITHRRVEAPDNESKILLEEPVADHENGMRRVFEMIATGDGAVVENVFGIDAVGHRVVHGGEFFQTPVCIDDAVIDAIKKTIPLAPLHNPANLTGIRATLELFPHAPQVAVFDTSFHQTLPPFAFHYALPYEYYEELGVRRYGFHGTSHQYVAKETARILDRPLEDLNLITAHLGSGASICAIEKGRSVDTTMGMTPLGGVIMGTRGGNIDPGVLTYVAEQKGLSIRELDHILQRQSGLKGICGSNDMRDIHEKAAAGDYRARLALDMFVYRNRQYIGAYFFELGCVDALVFTAGIGEHDRVIRERCCEKMDYFGVFLDTARNRLQPGEPRIISTLESPVKVLVIPTNEELEIARQTRDLLASL
jgi:acetate kinase